MKYRCVALDMVHFLLVLSCVVDDVMSEVVLLLLERAFARPSHKPVKRSSSRPNASSKKVILLAFYNQRLVIYSTTTRASDYW